MKNVNLWKSVGISFLVLILSLLIRISNAPENILNTAPVSLFASQYDLVLISFSILTGSYFTFEHPNTSAKNLFPPMAVNFAVLVICFALGSIAKTHWSVVINHSNYFKVWGPNLLGLFSVGFSTYFVKA